MGSAINTWCKVSTVFIVCIFLFIDTVNAKEIRLKSTNEPVAVVELYTSHGCSSCPPADAWLRKFTNHKDLWTKIIPMAFHVDYWDYLGWKDRFASSRYSNRQSDYRRSGRVRAVYTPGFVVAGKEWRGWFRGNVVNLSSDKQVGRLEARIVPDKNVTARFMPDPDTGVQKLKAHVAVLGFGISSNIGAGENSGQKLTEDFVVLGDSFSSPNSDLKWQLPWPDIKDTNVNRKAVVVWLSREGDPAPVQAVGGWLN